MAADNKPAAEHAVDTELVRGLLADQHPELAALPLREFASGWDNVIYRLGDAHCVRLPHRQLGADLVAHEQTWLPRLAPSQFLCAGGRSAIKSLSAASTWILPSLSARARQSNRPWLRMAATFST